MVMLLVSWKGEDAGCMKDRVRVDGMEGAEVFAGERGSVDEKGSFLYQAGLCNPGRRNGHKHTRRVWHCSSLSVVGDRLLYRVDRLNGIISN